MSAICTLGIDPGGTSGLFLGAWRTGERKPYLTRAWQCDMAATPELLGWILDHYTQIDAVQVEAFDARERSRKMRGFSASNMHKLIADLVTICHGAGVAVVTRPPAPVKAWATDDRLRDAGLYKLTAGKPHARDAARHALYAAVRDLGLRDPKSARGEERGDARAPATG